MACRRGRLVDPSGSTVNHLTSPAVGTVHAPIEDRSVRGRHATPSPPFPSAAPETAKPVRWESLATAIGTFTSSSKMAVEGSSDQDSSRRRRPESRLTNTSAGLSTAVSTSFASRAQSKTSSLLSSTLPPMPMWSSRTGGLSFPSSSCPRVMAQISPERVSTAESGYRRTPSHRGFGWPRFKKPSSSRQHWPGSLRVTRYPLRRELTTRTPRGGMTGLSSSSTSNHGKTTSPAS